MLGGKGDLNGLSGLLAAILHQVGVGWELCAALLKTDEFLHSCEKCVCTFATDGFQILLVYFLLCLGFVLSKIVTVLIHSCAIGTVKDEPWRVLTAG